MCGLPAPPGRTGEPSRETRARFPWFAAKPSRREGLAECHDWPAAHHHKASGRGGEQSSCRAAGLGCETRAATRARGLVQTAATGRYTALRITLVRRRVQGCTWPGSRLGAVAASGARDQGEGQPRSRSTTPQRDEKAETRRDATGTERGRMQRRVHSMLVGWQAYGDALRARSLRTHCELIGNSLGTHWEGTLAALANPTAPAETRTPPFRPTSPCSKAPDKTVSQRA